MNIIAVSSDTQTGSIATKLELELSYPVVADTNKYLIRYLGLESPLDLKSLPALYMIDSNMVIVWAHTGIDHSDKPSIEAILQFYKKFYKN